MSTQIAHLMHTEKKGYFWRKRYDKNTIEIVLHTQELSLAQPRAAALTIRFMQLEVLSVPFQSMRETLKAYRDELMKQEKLAYLQAMVAKATGSAQSDSSPVPMQAPTQAEKVAQIVIERELEQVQGHTLEECKSEFFNASTEWSAKTIKDYSACIDRFIVWGAANQILTVEAVTKDNIIQFKAYMDAENLAPNTKQKVLTRLGSMFKFVVDVKDWIVKNPVTGLMYKKVGTVTKKEEITLEQFRMCQTHPLTANNAPVFWANAMMFYTGMRVSELCQLTKNDYIEIEGIKCVSVNTHEEGKSTKTETSKRNIPLCDALLNLGVWDVKPVMKTGLNSVMDKCSKSFKNVGLKRSTHCFRYSLSNRLRDTDCEDSTRYFILGHAQETMTDRVYVTREPLLKMQRALNAAN